jgi:translation initiation factor 6 (eIF-6)
MTSLSADFFSNVQRTVQNTVTRTTVSHTTLVQTSMSTEQTTIVVPETSTVTEDITMYVE